VHAFFFSRHLFFGNEVAVIVSSSHVSKAGRFRVTPCADLSFFGRHRANELHTLGARLADTQLNLHIMPKEQHRRSECGLNAESEPQPKRH
jgi:hypothetical protein